MRFVFTAAQRLSTHPEYDLMLDGISTGQQNLITRESVPLSICSIVKRPHQDRDYPGFPWPPYRWTKTETSFLGILTLFALTQRAVVFSVIWSGISIDIMKVILAMMLVAVFWSQEWKSAFSDTIIHIGKLLRFFSSNRGHCLGLCASLRKQTGGFSLDICCLNHSTARDFLTRCYVASSMRMLSLGYNKYMWMLVKWWSRDLPRHMGMVLY